ncbi:MAG: hypothetical protein KAR07_03895, partial [Spirochaetes bacterium]|nr:hypothetical protein [Spirochaetota bacterium]
YYSNGRYYRDNRVFRIIRGLTYVLHGGRRYRLINGRYYWGERYYYYENGRYYPEDVDYYNDYSSDDDYDDYDDDDDNDDYDD